MIIILCLLTFLGGAAALCWEILWQHYNCLALGLSSLGTALTLGTLMGSMALGALIIPRVMNRAYWSERPLLLYGMLEGCIGLAGLALAPGYQLLSNVDVTLFRAIPSIAPAMYLLGAVLIIALPSACMGASIPVLGEIAHRARMKLSVLYVCNITGASVGILLFAFVLLRQYGITVATLTVAMINLSVLLCCVLLQGRANAPETLVEGETKPLQEIHPSRNPNWAYLALVTGFVTFGLEVAWFRALRSVFQSTTDVFAVLLFAVLLLLAVGGLIAGKLERKPQVLTICLLLAGLSIFLITPLVERLDLFRPFPGNYFHRVMTWLGITLLCFAGPMTLLAIPLPWLFDAMRETKQRSKLYALNTFGAIVGSVLTGWFFLPHLGFAKTTWLLGGTLVISACFIATSRARRWYLPLAIGVLAVSMYFNSQPGVDRVLGVQNDKYTILAYHEGPDVTTSVIQSETAQELYIDGFSTTGEMQGAAYMTWMGRLPMVLHPNPEQALVICMGTGQTAYGVLDEGPKHLDIVDINPAVFKFAELFESNHGVLEDARTTHHLMDGRAWLRRTEKKYDVITLEPMPPQFAGANNLYSVEFYQLAASRLNTGGIVAQWLPFHLVTPEHSAAICAAFDKVFDDCILWVEPHCGTGIILGRVRPEGSSPLGNEWPGLSRYLIERPLEWESIKTSIWLSPKLFHEYAMLGVAVTDDNQTLSYGPGRATEYSIINLTKLNLGLLRKFSELSRQKTGSR